MAKAYLVARLVVSLLATMETTACNVLYVDRRVREDRYIDRSQVLDQVDWESSHIAENAKLLVDAFGEGMPVLPVNASCFG